MPTSRRNFVFFMGIGGATIASLTAAGFLYRAADRGSFSDLRSGKPFKPWLEWQERQLGGLEAIALAGTLAASSLNSQPWLLRLEGDIIDLYFRRQQYPVFIDPFDRDALLGLGACLENMVTAAEGLGRPATVSMFPSPTNIDHVARLALGAGAPNETPRFLAIAKRRTNRAPYERDRMPPADIMASLERLEPGGSARFSLFPAASEKGQDFGRAVVAAAKGVVEDPAMLSEHFLWFRQTMDQVRQDANGISFLTSGLSDLQVRAAMALPDITEQDFGQFWLHEISKTQIPNSPLFGILAVDDDNDAAQLIEAGRLMQRLHLELTTHGIAMQAMAHLNWMADREEARGRSTGFSERLAALSGTFGRMVLGLRLGYARWPARLSPRQSLPSVLVPRMGPRPTPLPENPRLRHPPAPEAKQP